MTGEVCNKKKLICIFNIDLYGYDENEVERNFFEKIR